MLEFRYELSQLEWEKVQKSDPTRLDIATLRYYLFWGVVVLSCGRSEKNLLLNIPVLDFAYSLVYVTNALTNSDEECLEFTESNSKLIFIKAEREIKIYADFSDWSCVCSLSDLKTNSLQFLDRLVNDVNQHAPNVYRYLVSSPEECI